jgi:hypothetical protein
VDRNEDFIRRLESLEDRVEAFEEQAAAGRDSPRQAALASDAASSGAVIVQVAITNRRYERGEYGDDHVWFDLVLTPSALAQPTRAIKGALEFCDLFGAPQFVLGYTLNERLQPNNPLNVHGIGFEYSQFNADHQWVVGTRLEDMAARLRVDQVLYEDGTAGQRA